jgi:hypothetical protein
MRDPDLVVRAQEAATALESAWRHWREVHWRSADPLPPVSSYVGYSLEAPWGQPRVILGICAEEAAYLAALLEGRDCGGPGHALVTAKPVGRSGGGPARGSDPGNGMGWPGAAGLVHVPAPSPACAGQQPLAATAHLRIASASLRAAGLDPADGQRRGRGQSGEDPLSGPWRPDPSEPGASAGHDRADVLPPIALAASRAVEAATASRSKAVSGSSAGREGQPGRQAGAAGGDSAALPRASGVPEVVALRPRPEFFSPAIRRPGSESFPADEAPPSASADAATWVAGELPGQAAVSDSAV